jgi:hypothetical protein
VVEKRRRLGTGKQVDEEIEVDKEIEVDDNN